MAHLRVMLYAGLYYRGDSQFSFFIHCDGMGGGDGLEAWKYTGGVKVLAVE